MKILKGLLVSGLALVAPLLLGAAEPDPTRQAAWSAGNASGEGNFQSYCMPCHGSEGKGDGMLAESLGVVPRNLADAAFTSSKSDAYLFKVIKEGGAAVGLTENMTPFSGQLSDEEIRNIVTYIRQSLCKCSDMSK